MQTYQTLLFVPVMFSEIILDFPRENRYVNYYFFALCLAMIYLQNLISISELVVIVYKELYFAW